MQNDIFDLASRYLQMIMPGSGVRQAPNVHSGPTATPSRDGSTAQVVTPAKPTIPGATGVRGAPLPPLPDADANAAIREAIKREKAEPATARERFPTAQPVQLKERARDQGSNLGDLLGLPENISGRIGDFARGVGSTDPRLPPLTAAAHSFAATRNARNDREEREADLLEKREEKQRLNMSRDRMINNLVRRNIARDQDEALAMVDSGIADDLLMNAVLGPESTPAQRDYNYAVSQGYPHDFQTFLTEKARAGATTIDMGQTESSEAKEKGKVRVNVIGDVARDATKAQEDLLTMQRLDTLLSATDTGAVPALLDGVRQLTGVALGEEAGKRQAIGSMLDYLTPRMRVPGSGDTSNREMKSFRNALPSMLGTPEGNQIVAQTLGGLFTYRSQVTALAEQYIYSGDFSAEDYKEAVAALPDPFATYKQWQETNRNASSAQDYSDMSNDDLLKLLGD